MLFRSASKILSAFLGRVEFEVKSALAEDDLATARRLVNGGSHGLDEFDRTYRAGERELPAS